MSNLGVHPYIGQVYEKTIGNSASLRESKFINNFFANWAGNFLHPFGDDLFGVNKLDDSLFYCYLVAQTSNFHWYAHSVSCGVYTIVFRELRCILEGLFIVYRIEKEHPESTLREKLALLSNAEEEGENFGKKAFKKSGYPGWEEYYAVYKQLSSHIHFSYSKTASVIAGIKRAGFSEAVDFTFDQRKLSEVYAVWKSFAKLAIEMSTQISIIYGAPNSIIGSI